VPTVSLDCVLVLELSPLVDTAWSTQTVSQAAVSLEHVWLLVRWLSANNVTQMSTVNLRIVWLESVSHLVQYPTMAVAMWVAIVCQAAVFLASVLGPDLSILEAIVARLQTVPEATAVSSELVSPPEVSLSTVHAVETPIAHLDIVLLESVSLLVQ
jgi:hypothetical protein